MFGSLSAEKAKKEGRRTTEGGLFPTYFRIFFSAHRAGKHFKDLSTNCNYHYSPFHTFSILYFQEIFREKRDNIIKKRLIMSQVLLNLFYIPIIPK